MALNLNSLRVYALGMAHRAIGDISRDLFRQLRNYVDMCAFLANTEEQKRFFTRAQNTLEKTDSLYYPLIQRALATVSEDAICTAGVNLGIDALSYGASELKKEAQQSGQPVFWITVAAACDPELNALVSQREAAGEFLWVLSANDEQNIEQAIQLAALHPKSDFALLLAPESITHELAVRFADIVNLVPILQLEKPEISDAAHSAVLELKGSRIFYGVQVTLNESTASTALDSEWLDVLAQHTLFCVYTHPGLSPASADTLCRSIYRSRTTTGSPVLLFDWEKDTVTIGKFIHPLAQVERRFSLT